jgi:protein O-mannosyl-transferase
MGRPATRDNLRPMATSSAGNARPLLPAWLMAGMLGLGTLALYWPATGLGFINYDDPQFVTSNAHVQGGLNWKGVRWAFGLNEGDYWHPLTWLSLMLDASFFGQKAGGFHFTNVAFHAVNCVLLFLLLWMLTGTFWRSVMVAVLFAWHPLRVESVAWVTERKDVLSGCFGLLSLIFYTCYAQREGEKAEDSSQQTEGEGSRSGVRRPGSLPHLPASIFFLLSLGFFACGLMSKAMLVTWPFVMLLLDYWPLGRMRIANGQWPMANWKSPILWRLVREKIPFFASSGILCVLTYLTERGRQGAADFDEPSVLLRLENALVAYARYLGKTFWPVKLAVPYVNPGHWSWLEAGGSVLVVVGVCLAAFWLGSRWRFLLVGWCWFLGTLIPVIGLTEGWGTFMADRYTYTPSIGVLMLIVWGVCELTRSWRSQVPVLLVLGGVVMALCLILTREQLGYWQDGETLFRHTLAVTENNDVAHNNLGTALEKKGRINEAIRQYQEAIRLKADRVETRNNLGVALGRNGQMEEAVKQFQEAIRLKPGDAPSHNNLGGAFYQQGRTDEAIRQYQEAIRLNPDYADPHNGLGVALDKSGRIDEAIHQLQEAIRLKPDHADAHYNLGVAFYQQGRTDEAIGQFQEVIRLKPDHAEAHNNLGTAFGRTGQTDKAIRQFEEALRLKPDYADARRNLDIMFATKSHSPQPPGPATNR